MKYDPRLSFRRIRQVLSMYVTMCGGSRFVHRLFGQETKP